MNRKLKRLVFVPLLPVTVLLLLPFLKFVSGANAALEGSWGADYSGRVRILGRTWRV